MRKKNLSVSTSQRNNVVGVKEYSKVGYRRRGPKGLESGNLHPERKEKGAHLGRTVSERKGVIETRSLRSLIARCATTQDQPSGKRKIFYRKQRRKVPLVVGRLGKEPSLTFCRRSYRGWDATGRRVSAKGRARRQKQWPVEEGEATTVGRGRASINFFTNTPIRGIRKRTGERVRRGVAGAMQKDDLLGDSHMGWG